MPEDSLSGCVITAAPLRKFRAHGPANVVQRPIADTADLVEFDLVLSPRAERSARRRRKKVLGISDTWDAHELRVDQVRQHVLSPILRELGGQRDRLRRYIVALQRTNFP